MTPRLRQVVLLTGDLPGALARAKATFGLRDGVRDESGMAALGFTHEVLSFDQTFLEIVAPRACQPRLRGTGRNSATGTWPTAPSPLNAATAVNPGEAG